MKRIVIGIERDIDKLGRLVIPKEYRRAYGLEKTVEIIPTEEGVLIRSKRYKVVELSEIDDKNRA